ncbi:MAG TPA: tetratricopeptide repeat protein, partial [Casimicrobiaceae bacterium]|nr:tetratricopeptide repeat protein [Casimicrobiaceae bacterium]
MTLLDWGRLNDALAGLRTARNAGLPSFGLFVNLCQACHACGLTDEAEQHALQAIALDAAQAAGHLCLAVVHQAKKRYSEAIECYERGYALAPDRVDCLWEIASCLLDQGDVPEAESVARRAISVHGESYVKSWTLLASALAMQKRWNEATAAFERAEAIEFQRGLNGEAFVMHAFQLFSFGRLDAAIDLYARYLPRSTNPGPHAHYGLLLLAAGHLRDGWPFYEFRWTFDKLLAIRPRLGRPEWRGQQLVGKRLLLWAEQGVGDVVQFIRLARAFKEKGAKVLLHVPERLREFAKCFRDVDRVVCEPAEFADSFDYHLSLMSASGALGIDLESIPSDVPYITIDPDRKRRWRDRLASTGKLRVGLAWAGNPNHEHDHLRSIALARLANLFGVEGVEFYSLQKEPRRDDVGALPSGAALIDLGPELIDFRDTAAAIAELDLVVAVDTAVVHIAGALAKPAWVMVQTPSDFRWLTEGDGNPWYPTVRLFRQRQPGDWDEVIAEVREALARAAREAHAGNVDLGPPATSNRLAPTTKRPSISPLCGIADTRYGIVQYLRREETLAHSLDVYGEWLQSQLEIVTGSLKPGSVVVEAGSGIGAHTMALAKAVGSEGAVFAYEPNADRMRVLFQNLHMNQVRMQVTLLERRLAGSTETTLLENAGCAGDGGADACDAIDDLALERLDALKINCASVAGEILQGASKTLRRLRPLLLVATDGEMSDRLTAILASFGYRCWRVVTPYFSATNYAARCEDIFGGRAASSLVAIPEERTALALLDGYDEVSRSGAKLNGEHVELEVISPQSPRVNALTRWFRALSVGRNPGGAVAARYPAATSNPTSEGIADPAAARSTNPAVVAARYYAAGEVLMRGDYDRGFELYENRFDALVDRAAAARRFESSLGIDRRWLRGPLTGRRIVIWCEQGFGDSVMMLRYLPMLKERGAAKVFVVCERELVGLVQAMPAVDRVLCGNDTIGPEDFDLQCPAMSLPHAFRTTWTTVPTATAYLTLPGDRIERWRKRLSAFDGLKVGLAWAGSETLEADTRRSIPLAKLQPIFDVPGARFVSLQKDRRLDEGGSGLPLLDLVSECGDFLDTAALIEALDLVISVDTAVAHVAGALGKKVWLLNRFESEWRWGRGLTHSVWYPTMTIFNQRNSVRWEDVIEDAASELRRLGGRESSVVEPPREEQGFDASFQSGSQSLQQGAAKAAEAKFRDAVRLRDGSAAAWNGLG